jgi:hypothetical protein
MTRKNVAESTDLKLRGIRKGCDRVQCFLCLGERMPEKKKSRIFGAENAEGMLLKLSQFEIGKKRVNSGI